MRPAAVILDFDGVVVDSLAAHLQAWAEAVAEIFGTPLPSFDELSGHSSRTIANILCRRYGDPSLATVLVAAKERCLADRKVPIPTFPAVAEFLAELRDLRLPHGIASNSKRQFVLASLDRLGLHVPTVVTATDVSRPKPAPDMFWECSNRLGIDASQRSRVVIFEDSPHGIKAGRAAGMTPIGVTSAVSSTALMAAGAVAACAGLREAQAAGWLRELPEV